MDRVEGWIGDFYVKHADRCPREDWPDAGTEAESSFIEAWKHAFVTRGVEHRFADLASLEMASDPPKFLDQHLPALVKASLELRRREDAGRGVAEVAATVEAARLASRDCPDCEGSGLAIRHVHPDILGRAVTFGGGEAPAGSAVAYPCSCPLGRFVARGLRQPGQQADPLTVDQYPTLRARPVRWSDRPDNRLRHHPARWDDEAGMPLGSGEVVDRGRALAALKAALSLHGASAGRGRAIYRGHRPEGQGEAAGPPAGHPSGGAEEVRPEIPPPAREIRIPEDDMLGWF
jgi:hypothetical protein